MVKHVALVFTEHEGSHAENEVSHRAKVQGFVEKWIIRDGALTNLCVRPTLGFFRHRGGLYFPTPLHRSLLHYPGTQSENLKAGVTQGWGQESFGRAFI